MVDCFDDAPKCILKEFNTKFTKSAAVRLISKPKNRLAIQTKDLYMPVDLYILKPTVMTMKTLGKRKSILSPNKDKNLNCNMKSGL